MPEEPLPHRAPGSDPSLVDRCRVTLSRLGLRPGEYSGDYRNLARLYRHPDPWRLGHRREVHRFEQTNATISRLMPDCASLLEIGSGEGHQTAYLRRVTGDILGVEVSAAAIVRARQRVPDASFMQGRGEDIAVIVGSRRFSLATACEVLSYSPDAAAILSQLQTVAYRILVTNYLGQRRRVAALCEGAGWMRLPDIVSGRDRWLCHTWADPTR